MVSQFVCNAAIQNKIAETMPRALRRSTLEDTCIGKVMGLFYNLLLGQRMCFAVAVVVTECRCVNIRTCNLQWALLECNNFTVLDI